MFPAAEFPARTTGPNEFIDDCRTTFDAEKRHALMPDGMPRRSIPTNWSLYIVTLDKISFAQSVRRIKTSSKKSEEIICEITVAMATPSTSILNTATKTRFKITLTTPANEST